MDNVVLDVSLQVIGITITDDLLMMFLVEEEKSWAKMSFSNSLTLGSIFTIFCEYDVFE